MLIDFIHFRTRLSLSIRIKYQLLCNKTHKRFPQEFLQQIEKYAQQKQL